MALTNAQRQARYRQRGKDARKAMGEGRTHVYEGAPDGRQSDDVHMPTSRFRPRYRALTDEEKALHDEIKEKAAELEALFGKVAKPSPDHARYAALAMTDLERGVMWAVKQLTL